MMDLPPPPILMPDANRWAIVRFWIVYWQVLFSMLPWMLLRQLAITLGDLLDAWWTCGKCYRFFNGELQIGYVGSGELLLTAGMFGERFTWLRWRDVVIDPGPLRARAQVVDGLTSEVMPAAIACTHFHEEHIGNAAWLAGHWGVQIFGSDVTLAAVRQPAAVPQGRRLMMGQPEPAVGVRLELLGAELGTPAGRLQVIAAAGHCDGHIAFYEPERRILFAGDAFLHEVYTAPNRDSDAREWIATLERFACLDVRTLVGAHGCVHSLDAEFPPRFAVVRRADPNQLIRDKLTFMRWAQEVVATGERRGLPYAVIEACLFPWQRQWSWRTWFHDEGFRLLSCGEFSRTHFVRSLSATPQQVPVRFPVFSGVARRLALRGPELLRIHLLAARPLPVLVIAGSILWCAGVLAGMTALIVPGASPVGGAAILIEAGYPAWLLPVLAVWCWWWAVVGGAVTRVMGLAVAGMPDERFRTSLRICLAPALFLPSALASGCLLACALAPRWPWLLALVPPVWLVAGFLYGAMCIDRQGVGGASRILIERLRSPWPLLKAQALFLVSFAMSTGLLYAVVGCWWLLASAIGGGWTTPLTLLLAAPLLIYGLGYTTANLKSLQLWLYVATGKEVGR